MNQVAIHRLLAGKSLAKPSKKDLPALFEKRLAANLTLIQDLYYSLYPGQDAAFEELPGMLGKLFRDRPEDLRFQDLERLNEGAWYQSEKWVGMQLYADRFSGDIRGLIDKLPYSLGTFNYCSHVFAPCSIKFLLTFYIQIAHRYLIYKI